MKICSASCCTRQATKKEVYLHKQANVIRPTASSDLANRKSVKRIRHVIMSTDLNIIRIIMESVQMIQRKSSHRPKWPVGANSEDEVMHPNWSGCKQKYVKCNGKSYRACRRGPIHSAHVISEKTDFKHDRTPRYGAECSDPKQRSEILNLKSKDMSCCWWQRIDLCSHLQ